MLQRQKTTGLNKPKVVWPYIPDEIHKKFIFVHFILYIYCTHLTWCMAPIWPHSGCVCIKNDNTWHSPPSSGSDFNFLALSFQQMNHVFEIVSSLPTTATSQEHFAPNKVYCQFKFNSLLFIYHQRCFILKGKDYNNIEKPQQSDAPLWASALATVGRKNSL